MINPKLQLRKFLQIAKFWVWYVCRQIVSPFSSSYKKFDVAILYLTAERNRYPHTRAFVEQYRRWLGKERVKLICIDNFAPTAVPRQVDDGIWEIGGDNTYWEFSGWKRAIHSLPQLGISPEVLVFINDACMNQAATVNRNALFYRMRYDWRALDRARHEMVGCIESHKSHQNHRLLGHDVSSHVRSNFFALPTILAKDLTWAEIVPPVLPRLIPEKYLDRVINSTADSSEELQQFLQDWLTKSWQRATEPNEENWPLLRQKLIAILNERMLTASVRAKRIPIYDADKIIWG